MTRDCWKGDARVLEEVVVARGREEWRPVPAAPGPGAARRRRLPGVGRQARRAPEVVCAINQALLDGVLQGLGGQRVHAILAPRPDACCVELRALGARRVSGDEVVDRNI
jgi:hypothetical protein